MKHLGWILSILVCWLTLSFALNLNGLSCADVKRAFKRQNIGPTTLFPSFASNQRLSVCPNHGPNCCNSQTEKKFLLLAKEPMSEIVDGKFNSLKSEFTNFLHKFEGEMEAALDRTKQEATQLIMKELKKSRTRDRASSIVSHFFRDILNALDRNATNDVSGSVHRFSGSIFELKFAEQMNNNDLVDVGGECILNQSVRAPRFERIPKQLTKHLITTLNQTTTFIQAVQAAVDALNVSNGDFLSRDCENALAQMKYCSHCQIFTEAKPCRGYCRNVVSGCLVGVGEINRFWQYYVNSLTKLANHMLLRHHDVDSFLVNLIEKVKELVAGRIERNVVNSVKEKCSLIPQSIERPKRSPDIKKAKKKRYHKVLQVDDKLESERSTLKPLMREFIHFLHVKTKFFLNLPEDICNSRHYFSVEGNCWDGNTVIHSYGRHVSEKGLKGQLSNPEMQVDGVSSRVQHSVEKFRISTKMLKVGVDDPVPIFLLQPPYYVTDKSNQSESSVQESTDPCWDDEDGCSDVSSGDDDVMGENDGNDYDVMDENESDSRHSERVYLDLQNPGEKKNARPKQRENEEDVNLHPSASTILPLAKDSILSKSKSLELGAELDVELPTPPNSAQGFAGRHSNYWTISSLLFTIFIWKLLS